MEKGKKKGGYGRIRGDSGQHRRILSVALALGIAAFIPIGVQLYRLMVTQYDYYRQKALNNQTRTTAVTPDRGTVYDRNMNILACSESVETVYLAPRELQQAGVELEQLATHLAELLDEDRETILKKAGDLSLRYQQIASGVQAQTAQSLRQYLSQNQIDGVHLEPSSKRVYPYGALAAQLIGFVNASNTGSEGIEAAYNSFLQGGSDQVITGKSNHETDMPYSYQAYLAARQGCDVTLTLDVTVQACLEKQMQAAIERYDVQNGAFGLVMDVDTGEVLAMATLGSYDPNDYLQICDEKTAAELASLKAQYLACPEGTQLYGQLKENYQQALLQAQLKQWRNRCICDGYEPGSTFKLLTMAAALDCGAIDLNSRFHCAGAQMIPGRSQLLHCWRSTGHGSQTTAQALQNSCNLAFAHIALALGGQRFYEYIEKFGIMEKTGIDLLGESKGVFFERSVITDTEKWGTASLTSASFGQTFKITPLQLVRAICAVVNGGRLIEPYVVSEVTDAEGNTVLKQEPTAVEQVIRPETSKTMCALMESVVTDGTAKNAQIYGFSIGGKTGTSEKIGVLDENGQPTLDKIVSFVGVAPMDDPRYIVLVALDTPSRQTGVYISGGVMAAPTVGAVLADILPYLGVANTPDAIQSQKVSLEDLTGLSPEDVSQKLAQQGLCPVIQGNGPVVTGQIPAAGARISGGSQVMVYCGPVLEKMTVSVPDFTGMTYSQAAQKALEARLWITPQGNRDLSGTTVVALQQCPADTKVPVGTVIELTFADPEIRD